MKYQLLALFLVLFVSDLAAQAGIQFQAGISQAKNGDSYITPDATAHYGYFIGADAALNEGKMYLILGAQYHDISFMASEDKQFFSHSPSMKWFKIRTGLGFEIFRLSDNIQLHATALGTINVISSYPESMLDDPYGVFNTGTAGLVAGLELAYKNIGFQFEYEKGFFNAVNKLENTEFDFLSLAMTFRI